MSETEKPSRGIIMTGQSVRAILAGKKTQVRLPMKGLPSDVTMIDQNRGEFLPLAYRSGWWGEGNVWPKSEAGYQVRKIPYAVGDLLYVRETFGFYRRFGEDPTDRVLYKADLDSCGQCPLEIGGRIVMVNVRELWKPPAVMPRRFARIHLEVTGVRAERLQTITEGDAIAEGVTDTCTLVSLETGELVAKGHRGGYANIWGHIHGVGSWTQNPWVFVYTFKQAAG